MKICKDDYQDILTFLRTKRLEGREFVAFPGDNNISKKEGLFTFSSESEVQKFCKEMSNGQDNYEYLSTRSAYRAMSKASKNQNPSFQQSGLIDISALVNQYYQRLAEQPLSNHQNLNIMNEKNYDYLKDQVKFTGFGEGLVNELKEKLEKQTPQFLLLHEGSFSRDQTMATLHFQKSDKSDLYFFNKYDLTLKKENKPEVQTQTFYLNKDQSITLKEAYNLMDGRAINKDLKNKEGELYNAWLQMDFKQTDAQGNFKLKQFHQNYGYDLKEALAKHPIKELAIEQDRSKLIDSLQKGNRQSVTFEQNGQETKRFIEANPQFKTINIYDQAMQRVMNRQDNSEKHSEKDKLSVNKDQKNSDQDSLPKLSKAAKSRKAKTGQSIH